MALNLGSTAISSLRLGTATPSKMMLGTTQVWPAAGGEPWTPANLPGTAWEWYDFSRTDLVVLGNGNTTVSSVVSARAGSAQTMRQSNASSQLIWNPAAAGKPPAAEGQPMTTSISQRKFLECPAQIGSGTIYAIGLLEKTTMVNPDVPGNSKQVKVIYAHGDSKTAPYYEIKTGSGWSAPNVNSFTGYLNGLLVSNQDHGGEPLPFIATFGNQGTYDVTNASERYFIGSFSWDYAMSTGSLGGKLYELVLVGGGVDEATRQKLEGYMAWKPGNEALGLIAKLPANHPYKNAPPTQ